MTATCSSSERLTRPRFWNSQQMHSRCAVSFHRPVLSARRSPDTCLPQTRQRGSLTCPEEQQAQGQQPRAPHHADRPAAQVSCSDARRSRSLPAGGKQTSEPPLPVAGLLSRSLPTRGLRSGGLSGRRAGGRQKPTRSREDERAGLKQGRRWRQRGGGPSRQTVRAAARSVPLLLLPEARLGVHPLRGVRRTPREPLGSGPSPDTQGARDLGGTEAPRPCLAHGPAALNTLAQSLAL